MVSERRGAACCASSAGQALPYKTVASSFSWFQVFMRARSIAISIGLLFAALAVVAYFVLPDYRNAIEEQRSKAESL